MFIKIENYTKRIKNDIILEDINISLAKGKAYGFVGRNGSGKSMLMKSICGMLKIDTGRILIDGKELGKDIECHPSIGALLDGGGFLNNLTGFENLKLLASIRNKITDERIIHTLKIVGLDPKDKKNYKKYSLGMKQKLAIAQAIMEDPDILVLDEPFNSLDSQTVNEMRSLLKQLKENGKTILISSHIDNDIKMICDEIFEIDKGRIVNNYINN
ncbi:ABC transporter ATP-binding protein [Romboutsia timonensis]|uniref:ABC transporter ATP-binding protein n=1 Tax=Romboutsia timonensis TaxID=1776391 RepID=UPI002A75ECC5|nr:ATP-binding cassette domain-containing protein [Romboutsia timonensis]MDY3000187.1 ATP-binding cassette domain-containing protein [Romboutsia timonensis]MDY3960214.1 ATP-binding cassette domain-containing protein [Romboutsia timonensis]